MQHPDRLTIEEVEDWAVAGGMANIYHVKLAKQLLDTMRENEQLKARIKGMEGAFAVEAAYAEEEPHKFAHIRRSRPQDEST